MAEENPYVAPGAEPTVVPRITFAPERIRFVADLTAADQVATIRLLTRMYQKSSPAWLTIIVGFAIGLGFMGLCHLTHQDPGLAALDAGILLISLYALLIITNRFRIGRERDTLSRSPFLGACEFDLGPEALDMSGPGGYHWHVPWAAVDSVVETPAMLVIRYNPLAGWWIPRRNLGDQKNVDAVVAFIRARNHGVTREQVDAQGRVM